MKMLPVQRGFPYRQPDLKSHFLSSAPENTDYQRGRDIGSPPGK